MRWLIYDGDVSTEMYKTFFCLCVFLWFCALTCLRLLPPRPRFPFFGPTIYWRSRVPKPHGVMASFSSWCCTASAPAARSSRLKALAQTSSSAPFQRRWPSRVEPRLQSRTSGTGLTAFLGKSTPATILAMGRRNPNRLHHASKLSLVFFPPLIASS